MGGRQAHPLSLIVGGDSGPPGEQDTVTWDALLFLPPLHIVCVEFLLACPLTVAICGGMGDGYFGNVCDVSFGHFFF